LCASGVGGAWAGGDLAAAVAPVESIGVGKVGSVLPVAPSVAPGRVASPPSDPLAAAIERRTQGDLRAAAWHYEQWLARKGGEARLRAAVQLALGLVYLDLGEPNLASALFSKVRAADVPVSPWGAWFEALADHRRGRHEVAAAECARYREKWPEGPHADECLVLVGDAYVAAGKRGSAIAAYKAYLDAHPGTPLEETLRLGIALAVANTDPRQGIPLLQELVLSHAYHSTGETAEARLRELAAQGHPNALSGDGITQCRIAAERKRCGFEAEAWSRFQALEEQAVRDPVVAAWIEAHEDSFRWGTKQYERVAEILAEQHAAKPSSELAWQRYRALTKAGRWKDAMAQWREGLRQYPKSRFSGNREERAKAETLAGDYAEAVETWGALARGGGRHPRFMLGYAMLRAGNAAGALERFDALAKSGDEDDRLGPRWYRARALSDLGRTDEARAEHASLAKDSPWSWYGVLAAQALRGAAPGDTSDTGARVGRYAGAARQVLPSLVRAGTGGSGVAWPAAAAGPAPGAAPRVDWRSLKWGELASLPTGSTDPEPAAVTEPPGARAAEAARESGERRPDAYRRGFLVDPAAGTAALERLVAAHGAKFPGADAVLDLGRAGAFTLAAPVIARLYDAIDPNVGGKADPSVDLDVAEWRAIFLLARDDYHVARFSWGATKLARTEAERVDALRLQFPTAHADALYRHGRELDVDPLLALGLMRQESVYRAWALSPAGAIGLMQVMPRTGARVAALLGDRTYSPEVLQEPSTNIRYGMFYLQRLMERFDGAFPLAVASYNGGPHNVSAWLRPWGGNIRMDDFVEQIPYPETRDYVKKVTGYYATYVALYAPVGSYIDVPAHPRGDDASVINF
jgi:soluble lytic murein transglycosylase-like protein/TolA-binding protein